MLQLSKIELRYAKLPAVNSEFAKHNLGTDTVVMKAKTIRKEIIPI